MIVKKIKKKIYIKKFKAYTLYPPYPLVLKDRIEYVFRNSIIYKNNQETPYIRHDFLDKIK